MWRSLQDIIHQVFGAEDLVIEIPDLVPWEERNWRLDFSEQTCSPVRGMAKLSHEKSMLCRNHIA
jgi:hypothetical protein